jgi:hypothetical protein
LSGAIFVLSGVAGAPVSPYFQAFCVDGDGPLSGWLTSRSEAYLIGREHEVSTRGHRFEVLVQSGETVVRVPACARLTDGDRPDTLRLENTCDRCVKFLVSRTSADGTVKAREINIDAKKSRRFRKLPGATLRVEGESDCGQ